MDIHAFFVDGHVYPIVKAAEMLEELCPLSVSQLQRTLNIGYSRAARILDLFAELGIVSHPTLMEGHCDPLVTAPEALLRVLKYLHEALSAEFGNDRAEGAAKSPKPLGQVPETADSAKPCLPILKPDTDEEGTLQTDSCSLRFTEEYAPAAPAAPASALTSAEQLRQAVEIACGHQRIGTSVLQRFMRIGYGRSAQLIDRMESLGIVGPDPGTKMGRPVLLTLEEALARLSAEED